MRSTWWMLGLVFVALVGLFAVIPVLAVSMPPQENAWVEMASMQQARSNLGAAVVEGKIYAIGGIVSSYQRFSGTTSEVLDTNEMYDPVVNSWVYRASMPISGSDFAVAVFEGNHY